eukprot:96992-Alexandrium_andersonii.AAC.1
MAEPPGSVEPLQPRTVDGKRPPRCLRLFSGPRERTDEMSAVLRRAGRGADDVDIVNAGNGPGPRDLSSDEVWREAEQQATS